mmetsp:Transcript_4278/g.6993  ORF Transcript_4278/g.6993 Transcript_4278/m.6993 type:complete len:737 (-) Transcript_4278:41-2251(-)
MDAHSGVAFFASLTAEPYKTVFADPPASFGRDSWGFSSPHPSSSTYSSRSRGLKQIWPDGSGDVTNETTLNSCTKVVNQVRSLNTYAKSEKSVRPVRAADKAPWWAARRKKEEFLWLAAETADVDLLRRLLKPPKKGEPPANLNSRSLYGRTPLHIAASVGNAECVALLVAARAMLEARTNSGLTALHIASQHGHRDATMMLLDRDADPISQQTSTWNLPLHLAAAHGRQEIVITLLEHSRGDVTEALRSRNNLGQLAAEASLDIATAQIFKDFEVTASRVHASQNSTDHYAARTIYYDGGVLLHNSRSDVVRRLLDKTNRPPSMHLADVFATSYFFEESKYMQSQSRICRFLRRIQHPPNIDVDNALDNSASWEECNSMQPRRSLGSNHSDLSRSSFAQVRTGRQIEKVGPDSFEFVKMLGKGSFGEVYKVRHKRTDEFFAMKVQHKKRVVRENIMRYAMTERNVLCYLRHPYIASLHFAFQTDGYLVLVLKFYPGGNMQELLEKEKRLPESVARLYAAELLLALIYLHERSIIYRDMKPENVVFDEDRHAVMTDFGLSKEGAIGENNQTFCGSLAYLAPEVLRRQGHGRSVDVYGLGTLLYAMLTGRPPFFDKDRETMFQNIQKSRLSFPEHSVPQVARALIIGLMDRDPRKRIGITHTADVKNHEFFDCIDFELLMERKVSVEDSELQARVQAADAQQIPTVQHKTKDPFSPNATQKAGKCDSVQNWSWQALN